jgi:hypothetical protein
MHESVVDPQPAPNSADLAAENRRRTALKLLGIAAVIAAAGVFFALVLFGGFHEVSLSYRHHR